MNRDIIVGITCCGNTVSPGMIECLRNNGERNIKIVGFDMVDTPLASAFVDKFIKIPAGDSANYVEEMLNICKKERVNVLLPCDDNEALVLAENCEAFESEAITIAVSRIDSLRKSLNKISFHQYLKNTEIQCARFKVATNLEEVENAIFDLNFPKKKVVIKPEFGFGGRGVRIIVPDNNQECFFKEKPGNIEISLDQLMVLLKGYETGSSKPRMLVTEYLPGDYYSIEVLSKDGKPYYIIPKRRVIGSASCTTLGVLDFNEKVIETAREICQAFGFDYIQNYEMKFNEEGEPIPYDLNPRVPASIAMSARAGANLLYFAVKMALDEEVPIVEIKPRMQMIRYYKEFYM